MLPMKVIFYIPQRPARHRQFFKLLPGDRDLHADHNFNSSIKDYDLDF